MSAFTKIRAEFDVNWTTVLVGWDGLGVLSPWPSRWTEFPSLVSGEEVGAYADERLASTAEPIEQDLILRLWAVDLRTESRGTIKDVLKPLSDLDGSDPAIELRKWRLVLLEQVLTELPQDALYGPMALTDFWQSFGFPPDSPHEVRGRENAVTPSEYFRQENLTRLLAHPYAWINDEKAAIRNQKWDKL